MENTKQLLGKFIAGTARKDERAVLRQSLLQLSDVELTQLLSSVWEEYTFADAADRREVDKLLRQLHVQPSLPLRRRMVMRMFTKASGIAAAFFIPLALGATFYLYVENSRLASFVDKQVSVYVKSGDKAEITLPDSSVVYLNAATMLSYASDYGMKRRAVDLRGEAYLKVVHNPTAPFYVNAGEVLIEVLGTEFNVSSYEELDLIETTLVDGSIKLTTRGAHPQIVQLSPNEKAIYYKRDGRLTVAAVDPYFETAWLRGELQFRSAEFADIIYKLQQRYDVTITVVGNRSYHERFTGSFKEDNVYGVLRSLQLHYHFTYTATTDKKIEVHFK
ncbi:MAG: FecR domain-containing protein [Prevotellaceae bacterium]|jgi:ferric-dicitrate binding protein FerR (iron transport regulator)|nr:FecR domain-containing protein [Prevotellaceae bacterium]